jgi:perosamine synthetase
VPVHKHPFYRDERGAKGQKFPVAEDAYERLLSLPMFHGMTDEDVDEVIEAVRKVVDAFN